MHRPHKLVCLLVLVLGFSITTTRAEAQSNAELERINWERQVAYLETLIAKEPSLPMHYHRMAQAYARLGNQAQVERFSREAVAHGGSPIAADILLGDFHFDQGRYRDALPHYLKVLQKSPGQAHTLTQIWLLMQRERSDNLRLPVDQATVVQRLNNAGFFLSPTTPSGNGNLANDQISLGNQHINNNDTRRAIEAYKAAASHDPWNPAIYRGLGITYARAADYKRAVGAYHLYMALAPPNTPDLPQVHQIILDYYRNGR